jgi:ubiquinone/menaquinone biosynthesis C-methylase UbiE
LKRQLEEVGVSGRAVCQLCCNDGHELLSLRNMGAARCVGFDHSERFIAYARELAAIAGADAAVEYVTADVYEVPRSYDCSFDIVMSTVGVLRWLPDVQKFFAVAYRLLKPGSHLVVEDMHPVLSMYARRHAGTPSRLAYSYFKHRFKDDRIDHYGPPQGGTPVRAYRFQHTMAQILMGAKELGLQLEHISELDRDISVVYHDLERATAKPPLGFVLVWKKP